MDDRSILDQLRAELAELRSENSELRERVDRLEAPAAPARRRSTRRGALAMAAGAAGGVVAASLGAAAPAGAADGGSMLLGEGNGADVQTGLEVTGSAVAYGFGVTDNGLSALPDGYYPTILAHANDHAFRTAILAYISSTGAGATAISAVNDQTSSAVDLAGADANGIGVSAPEGVGVSVEAGLDAVFGISLGSGAGVHGASLTGNGPAVLADAENGTGTGLLAQSAGGRGIVTSGRVAPLQLTPGTQAKHPKDGEAGDLFVDESVRLWFCKAGGVKATWKQIA